MHIYLSNGEVDQYREESATVNLDFSSYIHNSSVVDEQCACKIPMSLANMTSDLINSHKDMQSAEPKAVRKVDYG